MPFIDLNSPTGLLLEWGWLLVTRANGVVYLLLVVAFVLGATVRLPRAKRDLSVARSQVDDERRSTSATGAEGS